ncbi:tetratricopeptide repeat protein [Ascidiaceihabitans sp.]|uniref:tetratricopeptide repeat protein n=1 Tax=Ascidiaceihabitans sp. TaxID=1872644 RepID=UPI0032990FDE
MSLFGDGSGQTQKGGHDNTQIIGMDPATFVAEMRRKDARIDGLIAEKDALKDQVSALEREKLESELQDLRVQKAGLEARIAQPDAAFVEHTERATRIEALLSDIATQQAVGENRIRSALQGFAELEYAEVDALLEDTEQQGILLVANAAYGRGLVAEDAIKWHAAYDHYERAARFSEDEIHLKAQARMAWRLQLGNVSVDLQRRLVTASEKQFGSKSPEYATQLNNLAGVVNAQGRFAEAEGLYREALEIDRATIGEGHPEYATRFNNLASVVQAQGRFAEAEGLYREALEIDRATIGEGHPSYATRLNNLAGVVEAQGRFAEAEGLYREALEIDRATIGEGHPDYATDLNNLALVVKAQGRYAEAEGLYREVLEIDRATIGEGHPSYAIHLNNFALVVNAQGRFADAEGLYRAALEITRATIGEAHPDYAIRLGNLGSLLGQTGRATEGREMLEQALGIFRATLPEDHPHIAETMRRIANLRDTP